MKYVLLHEDLRHVASPLAEGRELKCRSFFRNPPAKMSPLAEGRELKFSQIVLNRQVAGRPSRRGVN